MHMRSPVQTLREHLQSIQEDLRFSITMLADAVMAWNKMTLVKRIYGSRTWAERCALRLHAMTRHAWAQMTPKAIDFGTSPACQMVASPPPPLQGPRVLTQPQLGAWDLEPDGQFAVAVRG